MGQKIIYIRLTNTKNSLLCSLLLLQINEI